MLRLSCDWKKFLKEWSAEIMQLLREYQQYGLIDLEAEAIARNSFIYLLNPQIVTELREWEA